MPAEILNQIPAPNSNILPSQRIEFDVDGANKPYQLILSYEDGEEERAWNGTVFSPCFKRDSTKALGDYGDHFVLYRTGGWRKAPTIVLDTGDVYFLGAITTESVFSPSGVLQLLNDGNDGVSITDSSIDIQSVGDVNVTSGKTITLSGGIAIAPGDLATSGSITPNAADPAVQRLVMAGDCTINPPASGDPGSRIELYITGGNGSRTLSFDAAIKFGAGAPNAAPPGVPLAGKWYLVVLWTPDGSSWRGILSSSGDV